MHWAIRLARLLALVQPVHRKKYFSPFLSLLLRMGYLGDQGSGVAVAVPYEAKVEVVDAEKNEKKEIIQKALWSVSGPAR